MLTQPGVIGGIHREYLEAGAHIVETNTFNATQVVMADYDMQELAYEMNVAGARLAREVCDAVESETGIPRWVAGVLGPLNKTGSISPDVNDPGFRDITFEQMVETYSRGCRGLIEGGADILQIETVFDTLNAKAAHRGVSDQEIARSGA